MGEMDRKVVLVTGAAGAIGKPMCIALAERGATVVMAGRGTRIQEAAEDVRAASRSKQVEVLQLDLSSLASIRSAAEELHRRFSKLHVLINNAAVFTRDRQTTTDGFELLFGTNQLGHFLFTNLVVDLLKAGAPSRIILMTMDSKVPINFDDLMSERKYSALTALQMSKGAITCFGVELAQRLRDSGVTVHLVNPELTKSTLPREAPLPLRLVFKLFGQSPQDSKDYGVRVACEPAYEKVSGRYYRKGVEKPVPDLYANPRTRERLWNESARLVGLGTRG
jgi:NAD(P)-dependent dehydrogenase (short-subunit alcohol dehydrogenase family)